MGRDFAQIVEDNVQTAFGDQCAVQEFQCAGGRIAWIGKWELAFLFTCRVEAVKFFAGHEDLAAQLQNIGHFALKLQRQGANRF